MTLVSKKLYIDKLDDIVNRYNNTHHSTIKMKPVDVKSSTYTDSNKKNNEKNPINDTNVEETVGTSQEKELQKTSQNEFKTEIVVKRKCDNLYVK